MAASYLAAPGTHAGPCWHECQHTDCGLTRRMAYTPCQLCQEAIGYETGFYSEGRDKLIHRKCYLKQLEQEAQANGRH